MKSAALSLTFTLPACLTLLAGTGHAELLYYIRPDYQNLSSAQALTQNANRFVILLQGHIKPELSAPSNSTTLLTECSFGQPLAQWIPSSAWADDRVTFLRGKLYAPTSGTTPTELAATNIVFRYKTLLYAPSGPGQPILNNFDDIGLWFGDPERAAANDYIKQLRDDIAKAPFHTGLRNLLLDVIYDLAVAEMQGINKQLAELAKKRLGFTPPVAFIIDDEIEAYKALVAQMEGVLTKYQELLGNPIDGVEPSDFDPDFRVKNMPMGRYLFVRSQPTRNSVASKYLDAASGSEKNVPTLGDDPPGPAGPPVEERDTDTLFSGYKDYTTLYNILGRYVQYQADLARLLGMRQAPGDMTKARAITTHMQGKIASDFAEMENLCFPASFAKNDASGVYAARSGVETALADIANVRGFLSGKANLLGLDPNFLLLVQDPNPPSVGPRESFDVLRDKLKGENQPLTVALGRMAEAKADYEAYRGSVDRVVSELDDIETTHATRYREITGYDVDESPGFQGAPKPNSGSELDIVAQTITSLGRRLNVLAGLRSNLEQDQEEAEQSVTVAEDKRNLLTSATETYKTKTRKTYDGLAAINGAAAAAQAVADTAFTALSLDPLSTAKALGVAAAGAVNTGVQTANAVLSVKAQQELDYAALEFDAALDATDAELTVNQAKQEVGSIKRETYSQKLEVEDTMAAAFQAAAQKTALLTELTNIEKDLEGNTEALRSTYYADPIHYLRAENSLIHADESFRHAQRLLFYTQRAAEYKWQEKFAITESAQKSWDSTSLFKLRNAKELDDLLTQLVRWNDARATQVGNEETTTIISLRDNFLVPNPNVLNEDTSFISDFGTRVVPGSNPPVTETQLEFFRRTLRESVSNGVLSLPFDTTALRDLNSAFFTGATYNGNALISPGIWRDKIVWVRGNIISTGASFGTRTVSLDYGGNTFQRTRFPDSGGPIGINYLKGEFTSEPFVYWQSPTFNDRFVPKDVQPATATFGFSSGSALNWTVGGSEYPNVPELKAFNQLSVAATRWRLNINLNTSFIDLSKIEDIEIIIRHRYSQRIAP